jgi:hypothetical protein
MLLIIVVDRRKESLQIVRKQRSAPVLREVWQDTEDGSRMLLLKYPLLEATGMVEHCFTTRLGGVSEGIFATMNLSFTRGDKRESVETNYRRLAEAMKVDCERFVFTDQTHTVNVRRVTAEDAGKGLTRERDYQDVDGLITNEPGIVLSTFFADCVPLYFVDPVHRAIGMIHSGWRGTVGRMGKVTIEAMAEAYGTRPEDLICAIGPSICQDCYEVGEDVAAAFRAAFPGREQEILQEHTGKRAEIRKLTGNQTIETAEIEKTSEIAGRGKLTGNQTIETAEIEKTSEIAGRGKLTGNQTIETAEIEKTSEIAGRGKLTGNQTIETAEKKYQLDLWKANEIVLTEAGVKREHIAVTDICTCCNPEVLFSHRASHGKRGNLGGFLCLR